MTAIRNPEDLTAAVLAVMEATPEPRLRDIMVSLVGHLHAFVKEVQLTEGEFRSATALVARLGQLTNDHHNEVVLMAGSLGISSLVCLLNNGRPVANGADPGTLTTTQNLLGPFWRLNSPLTANGGSIVRSQPTPGEPLWVQARITDGLRQPLSGVEVDVWHCDADGHYENQAAARSKGHVDMNLRGKFVTDAAGFFSFWSVKPIGYPIPTDGVVGQLLAAQHRHPFRPAHVHVLAHKPGFKTLISQVYAHDDPNLATDTQFGVTAALIGHYEKQSGPAPGRPEIEGPWHRLEFDFDMQPGTSTLPKPPIK